MLKKIKTVQQKFVLRAKRWSEK